MTVTEASPREAAATEATTAAAAWLEAYLAEGPRFSAQLRRDALADGLQLPAVHDAATILSVRRISAGRWSRWALKAHAEASAERRCPVCHEVKDREAFRRPPTSRYPAGKMLAACGPCTDARSCRTDRRRPDASPAHIEAQEDRTASFAPDPATAVALRVELARQRAMGRPWGSAWPYAMHQAVDGLPHGDAVSWRRAFSSTATAWRSAFDRDEDAQAAHGALALLAEAA